MTENQPDQLSDAREALLTALAERALDAVQPEIDRLRANLTTVFHQLKAAERESEQRLGELLFWEFEYREAMDNYKGEAAHAKSLRAELEQARAAAFDEAADVVKQTIAPADSPSDFIAAWNAGTNIAAFNLRNLITPACSCAAEPVHQAGCDTT